MDYDLIAYTEEQERLRQRVRASIEDKVPTGMRTPLDPEDEFVEGRL